MKKDFTISVDEPVGLLGTNRFANPQEHLFAALNACMMVGYVAGCALEGITLRDLRIETSGVLDHARPHLADDDWRTRALLQFASEEAKHIQLFRRFREVFERGFGDRCEVIGPPAAIAKAVLDHDPLGVALAILQIEWMTQRHYVDSVAEDGTLDSRFKSLLRHHWTYLGSGMTHPQFIHSLSRVLPSARMRIEGIAPLFSFERPVAA